MNNFTDASHSDEPQTIQCINHLKAMLATDNEDSRAEAFAELVSLATNRHPEAMLYVARCFIVGRGVEQDRQAGHQWLELAANCKSPSCVALYEYGLAHIHGELELSYPHLGIDLLVKAEAKGHKLAMTDLLQLCNRPPHEQVARKATYRHLANRAAEPGAGVAAGETFKLFCENYKQLDLLDS